MGKTIVVACPRCGKKLKTDEKYMGRKGRCPSCQGPIVLSGENIRLDGEEFETATEEIKATAQKAAGTLLNIEKFPNRTGVVRFTTSRLLDQSNVTQLGAEFDDLVDKLGLNRLIINFERIHYMSSAVIGKLIALNKKIAREKGELRLCGIDPSVYEIFRTLRLDKVFKILKTEEEASRGLIS